MAAVLMATESLPAETALEHIAAAHPAADPNAGFRAQLELFGAEGLPVRLVSSVWLADRRLPAVLDGPIPQR